MMNTKKILTIRPLYDAPGKNDASGAFAPMSRAFVKLHGDGAGSQLAFDSRRALPDRRAESTAALRRYEAADLDVVAFFCHGWRDGIQAGFMLKDVPALAALLRAALRPDGARVALYCCDTGRDAGPERDDDRSPDHTGAGGFAAALSAALPNIPILGHTTAGHTTRNPFSMQFLGGVGQWYQRPQSSDWPRWFKAMQNTDLGLRLPWVAPGEGARAAVNEALR